MCVIAVYPPYVEPRAVDLLEAVKVNPEGFGTAFAGDGAISTWRGLEPLEAVSRFLRQRKARPASTAIFHARLSTGSAVSLQNCHPFRAGDDRSTMIFHNGTLPLPPSEESDTLRFARDEFAKWPHLDKEGVEAIGQWAGGMNKMAILTVNYPKYADSLYIVNRSQWLTSDGALFSNSDPFGEGVGWAQQRIGGDVYRWRVLQDGQCELCGLFHDPAEPHGPLLPVTGKPAYRNETERAYRVAVATMKEADRARSAQPT